MRFRHLREADRNQMLYHGTSVWGLAGIIASDVMYEGVHWGRRGEPHGPRFSRDPNVARQFIEYSSPDWPIGGVLAMSRNALEAKYDLVDYSDVDVAGGKWPIDEQEVVVVTPKIDPVSQFLTGINIPVQDIRAGMSEEGLEYAFDQFDFMEGDRDKAISVLTNLASHPLLGKPVF